MDSRLIAFYVLLLIAIPTSIIWFGIIVRMTWHFPVVFWTIEYKFIESGVAQT